MPKPTSAILLDIEGTTTPLAFVRGILFPYSLNAFKSINFSEPPYSKYLGQFQQYDSSLTAETLGPYLELLVKEDSKLPPLKELQGEIWRHAYEHGEIKAPVYDDVVPLLESNSCFIYSSGSVSAQKNLFCYSDKGDLTRHIKGYFDPSMVGHKNESQSYLNIAQRIGVFAEEILFVSDIPKETCAARAAGMQTALIIRPGNEAITSGDMQDNWVVYGLEKVCQD